MPFRVLPSPPATAERLPPPTSKTWRRSAPRRFAERNCIRLAALSAIERASLAAPAQANRACETAACRVPVIHFRGRLCDERDLRARSQGESLVRQRARRGSIARSPRRLLGFVARVSPRRRTVCVASLWNLNDRFGAAEFVERFYTSLNRGQSSQEALRRAKVAYVNHPKYSHPFYWSSLVMLGDGTRALVEEPVAEPIGQNLLAAALAVVALCIVVQQLRRG